MIEPTQGPAAISPISDPPPPLTARGDTPRERPAAETPPEPVAAKPPAPPPSDPVLDVHLDGETMRLYTELRDPQTDRVLLRLPAAYKEEGRGRTGASFEA